MAITLIIAHLFELDFLFIVGPEGSESNINKEGGSSNGPNKPELPEEVVPLHKGGDSSSEDNLPEEAAPGAPSEDNLGEDSVEKEELLFKALEMRELYLRSQDPSTPLSEEERSELEDYKQSMDSPQNKTNHTLVDYNNDVDSAVSAYESAKKD